MRSRPETCLSDLALDRLIAGEVEEPTHLAGCDACRSRLAELRADADSFAGSVWIAGAARRATRAAGASRWRWWAAIAVPAVAAAAVAIWIALPRDDAGAPGVRTKGSVALDVVVKRGDGTIERLGPAARVAPGEAVRFLVSTDRAGYLAILGLDAAGVVSAYLPDPGAPTPAIGAGREQAQPGSIILDETAGAERFVALVCPRAMEVDALVAAARRALVAAGNDPRRVAAIDAPCATASFVIDKAVR